MTNRITYQLTAPLRSSFTFTVEAEEGLTHRQICDLVSKDDLMNLSLNTDWGDIKDSWWDAWNAAYQSGSSFKQNPRYVDAWDATEIINIDTGVEVEK
tara:strand:+ start:320 stop:613 length:294 start_codon:yes stop_codon:yes gene_type:complete